MTPREGRIFLGCMRDDDTDYLYHLIIISSQLVPSEAYKLSLPFHDSRYYPNVSDKVCLLQIYPEGWEREGRRDTLIDAFGVRWHGLWG